MECRPVTPEVAGSSPVNLATAAFVKAQSAVTGSSQLRRFCFWLGLIVWYRWGISALV